MGFFIIPEALLEKFQNKKKKKTCDHNDTLSNGSLKTEQNAVFMLLWGSITQQEVIFMSIFFSKQVILLG